MKELWFIDPSTSAFSGDASKLLPLSFVVNAFPTEPSASKADVVLAYIAHQMPNSMFTLLAEVSPKSLSLKFRLPANLFIESLKLLVEVFYT